MNMSFKTPNLTLHVFNLWIKYYYEISLKKQQGLNMEELQRNRLALKTEINLERENLELKYNTYIKDSTFYDLKNEVSKLNFKQLKENYLNYWGDENN